MWLSQSIILPLYSASFLSRTVGHKNSWIKTNDRKEIGYREWAVRIADLFFGFGVLSSHHFLSVLFFSELGLEFSASDTTRHRSSSPPLVGTSCHYCQLERGAGYS